jgi:glycosyltransferase AglI
MKQQELKGRDKLLTIIIPVYKDSKGLNDTISTLIVNNPDLEDYEIIICNDGAGQEEIKIFEKLNRKYNTLKIINILPNGGSYNARSEGVKESNGDILAFLDAGVFLEKGWYNEMVSNIEEYDYLAGNVEVPIKWAKNSSEIYNSQKSFPVNKYIENHHFGVTANLVIKKNVIESVGLFDKRLRSGGDMEFGRRVYDAGYKQVFLKNMKVLHEPRNLEEMKRKTLRVQQGVYDLIKYYPESYTHLKYRFSYYIILKSIIRIIFFPWRDPVYRKKLLSYFDYIAIELSLIKNKIEVMNKIND